MGKGSFIRRWLTRKKNKKDAKKISVSQVIGSLLLMGFVFLVFSYSPYGADMYQGKIDQTPNASWAPDMQWRVAKVLRFWGEEFKASAGFKKYYDNYSEISQDRAFEAKYWEISCLMDGQKYATCENRIRGFYELYQGTEAEENEFYKRVVDVDRALKTIPQDKRYDHAF